MEIPKKGRKEDEVFADLDSYRKDDLNWRDGKTFSYVYHAGEEVERISKKAYMMFLSENGLDPTSFKSLARFEREVVSMARHHLQGDDDVVGNFTSGGTESILLSVKTARDRARKLFPEIKEPEMVVPVTAHAAFMKAGSYFDVKIVPVPVDPETFKAIPAEYEKAITKNTILLVGSAPSFAHGVVDPIEEIGKIAQAKDVLFHVDACIGGFLLPYFRRLGEAVPAFDFSVPGVTSISMDLHKYAYCPKGASVVLYRGKEIRRHQIFSTSRWTGYTMVNATFQSTKSGGPMAAAWATLNFVGDDGYLELARKVLEATKKSIAGIREIPDLRLLSTPEMSLVAFASDKVNVFHITDEMAARGWFVQAQLGYDNSPPNIHLTIGAGNVERIDELLRDLKDSVEAARKLPDSELAKAIPAIVSQLDPKTLDEDRLRQLLATAGVQGSNLPERNAEISEILNQLPSWLSERVLTTFANDLYSDS